MSVLLDEEYLTWLYSQVASVKTRNPNHTHWTLLRELFTTEFVWFIPNDDNRIEDGRDLRREFLDAFDILEENWEWDWMALGCSMLEMLIALSRRLAFEAEGEPSRWFWHMIGNLGLDHYSDSFCDNYPYQEAVRETLEVVIWRTYDSSGQGGLFPLESADEDQREVEIWYQLNAYILERSE